MILTLFGSRAFFGIKKQSRALASMVFKKTPVREQLATGGGGGGGGGCKWKLFRLHMSFFPFHAELATGGGCKSNFFPARIHVQQHTELKTRLGAAGISYATEAFLIMVKTLHLQ